MHNLALIQRGVLAIRFAALRNGHEALEASLRDRLLLEVSGIDAAVAGLDEELLPGSGLSVLFDKLGLTPDLSLFLRAKLQHRELCNGQRRLPAVCLRSLLPQ